MPSTNPLKSFSNSLKTNTQVVHTSSEDGRAHTDVGASHLHSGLPITRHSHAQLQRTCLGMLLNDFVTQLNEFLVVTRPPIAYREVGLRRSIHLSNGHQTHELQLRTVRKNKLSKRKALFRKAAALSRWSQTEWSGTSPHRLYALPQTR